MRQLAKISRISLILLLMTALNVVHRGWAATLMCSDSSNDLHHREVMATSAPEVKARATSEDDEAHWAKIVRPLTLKAVKLAKIQRAAAIEDGIEHSCSSSEQYVAQIIPVPNQVSGCEHHAVTRAGENGQVWVQVVAVCKYDWVCCSPEAKIAGMTSSTKPANPSSPPLLSSSTVSPPAAKR